MIKILAELKKEIGEAIITEACREKPAVFEYKQYKKDPVYTITVTADYDRVGEEKLESTNECQISTSENEPHPWGVFLEARAKCIIFFRINGKNDRQIADDLSIDEEQVYHIAKYQESLDRKEMNDTFGGIDPPTEKIGMPCPETPIISTCKKCGKTHGMVIQDMKTGECEPIDACIDCLMSWTFNPVTELTESMQEVSKEVEPCLDTENEK